MKLKCPLLLKLVATIIQEKYHSFYPSQPFRIIRFTMRHPVIETALTGDPCICILLLFLSNLSISYKENCVILSISFKQRQTVAWLLLWSFKPRHPKFVSPISMNIEMPVYCSYIQTNLAISQLFQLYPNYFIYIQILYY